jgi:hypothetical protein
MHTFCMTYHGLLGQFMLPPTCLMASGKLVALDALLKELKAAGSRPLIFSQVRRAGGSHCGMLVASAALCCLIVGCAGFWLLCFVGVSCRVCRGLLLVALHGRAGLGHALLPQFHDGS